MAQVTLQRGARHLEKNATIVTEEAIFHSTAGLSNVDTLLPKQNTMVQDNHTGTSMI